MIRVYGFFFVYNPFIELSYQDDQASGRAGFASGKGHSSCCSRSTYFIARSITRTTSISAASWATPSRPLHSLVHYRLHLNSPLFSHVFRRTLVELIRTWEEKAMSHEQAPVPLNRGIGGKSNEGKKSLNISNLIETITSCPHKFQKVVLTSPPR
ncbi:MAG: hypothetical protein ABF380_04870 [Akkermansiaceae bacterium]